jgi:hypothetical protein
MRNILLIEPAYKNKYPPLGLMKISAYHKKLGDRVVFYKGKSEELREQLWDKIYITTLFTFYWDITIDTIKYYKRSVYNTNNFHIGGITASLLKDKIYEEIRITPYFGLITSARKIGEELNTNIDTITPDYDILEEIDYEYPINNAYFANTTKGCTRKCPFCAVPCLEPVYKNRISIKKQINKIDKTYGQKRNLLLLDNNVLASKYFHEIIDEIKSLGFEKGAKFVEPIKFKVYINRLKTEDNKFEKEKIRIKAISEILNLENKIKNKDILKKYKILLDRYKINTDADIVILNKINTEIMPIFEKYHNKVTKERYVDYNQGVDLRYLTEDKIKKLSEIHIKPLRIAFDHINLTDGYIEKCKLAAKYEIKELSNYLLYNYKDTPEDLYKRLEININLNEELNVNIYSFPMKYIPIGNINRKDHVATEYGWNLKYIRAIQAISNVTRGVIGDGKSFFYKAFGKDLEEYKKILLMPEDYIIYRFESEGNGKTDKWWSQFSNLTEKQKEEILPIIYSNNFQNPELLTNDKDIIEVLKHYKRIMGKKKKKEKSDN